MTQRIAFPERYYALKERIKLNKQLKKKMDDYALGLELENEPLPMEENELSGPEIRNDQNIMRRRFNKLSYNIFDSKTDAQAFQNMTQPNNYQKIITLGPKLIKMFKGTHTSARDVYSYAQKQIDKKFSSNAQSSQAAASVQTPKSSDTWYCDICNKTMKLSSRNAHEKTAIHKRNFMLKQSKESPF